MSLPELIAAGIGLDLVATAVAWRALEHRRASLRLRRALVDPRPHIRLAAVRAVGSSGLTRHARLLLERTRAERDPEVLDALGEVVGRNLWEPSDTQALVALRIWAESRRIAEAATAAPVPVAVPVPAPVPVEVLAVPVAEAEPVTPVVEPEVVEPQVVVAEDVEPEPIALGAPDEERTIDRRTIDQCTLELVREVEEIVGGPVRSLRYVTDSEDIALEQVRAAS